MNQLTAKRLHVELRWLVLANLPRVLEIERLCFEHPWSEEGFRRVLAHRSNIGMAAWLPSATGNPLDEQLVGYMVYRLRRTSLILMNLAVLPAVQRRGVGMAMIAKLKAKLSPARRTSIVTDVRESNLDAQLFMRAVEFLAVEVVPDAYEGSTEDAYVFGYRLPAPQVKS